MYNMFGDISLYMHYDHRIKTFYDTTWPCNNITAEQCAKGGYYINNSVLMCCYCGDTLPAYRLNGQGRYDIFNDELNRFNTFGVTWHGDERTLYDERLTRRLAQDGFRCTRKHTVECNFCRQVITNAEWSNDDSDEWNDYDAHAVFGLKGCPLMLGMGTNNEPRSDHRHHAPNCADPHPIFRHNCDFNISLFRQQQHVHVDSVDDLGSKVTAVLTIDNQQCMQPTNERRGDATTQCCTTCTCPVCMDRTIDSVIKCGHAFCLPCLVQSSEKEKMGKKVCPFCRKEYTVIQHMFL